MVFCVYITFYSFYALCSCFAPVLVCAPIIIKIIINNNIALPGVVELCILLVIGLHSRL